MRLIDATKAIESIDEIVCSMSVCINSDYYNGMRSMKDMALHAIEKQPTVNVDPVVRCKECKHRPTKPDDYNPITTDGFALEFPDEKCPCQCEDGWYSKYPDDDWYCPIGERKGGERRGWPMQLVPDDGFCDKGERSDHA